MVLALTSLVGACASSTAVHVSQTTQARSNLDPSRIALAPLDYVRFCMDNSRECQLGTPNAVINHTPELDATLSSVNHDVNRRIRPTRDLAAWRINPAFGNCNDYVVTKRHHLIALGLPPSALLIATAKTPTGEGHLLLIVKTSRGDFVLDNLTPELRSPRETNYAWLKRQSAADPVVWERM